MESEPDLALVPNTDTTLMLFSKTQPETAEHEDKEDDGKTVMMTKKVRAGPL